MKKIFVLMISLVFAASLLLCNFAHAEEALPVDNSSTAVDEPSEGLTDIPEDPPVDLPADEPQPEETGTVAQTVSDWLAEHFGDITGTSCLIGVLAMIWSIRKKLLPIISAALDAVAKRSEDAQGSFKQEITTCRTMLELSGNYLDNCSKSVEKMIEDWKKRTAAQSKAYELQTDLINYLLMNLRIPNELKTEVSARAAEVKAAIQEARPEE